MSDKPTAQWWPLIGLPLVSVCLPWTWTFRILRFFAQRSTCFDEFIEPALAPMSAALGPSALAPEDFRWRYRLLKLIDQVDAWLAASRSERWTRQYVDVEGHWPPAPFIALGFHYGAGTFLWRHLRASGIRGHFLAQRFNAEELAHDRILYWSFRLRKHFIERAAGAEVVATGGAFARMKAILARGEVMVVLSDTPPQPDQQTQVVSMLGQKVSIPTGVFELARQSGVPLVPWSMHFDADTGRRKLKIYPALSHGADNPAWTQESLGILDSLIRHDPAGWHLWPQLALFSGHTSVTAAQK